MIIQDLSTIFFPVMFKIQDLLEIKGSDRQCMVVERRI